MTIAFLSLSSASLKNSRSLGDLISRSTNYTFTIISQRSLSSEESQLFKFSAKK
jgi:hypothetical protein